MTDVKAIRIPGLSRADALDLRERAGRDAVSMEPEPVPEGHLGEPVTLAVVLTLTTAALEAYAAFLTFRHRARNEAGTLPQKQTETIELMRADGTWERRTITYGQESRSALEELAAVPGLDGVASAPGGP